jgi:CHASE2 domain-containing sensor protein
LKYYRPHILVVVALAIVLSSGWHGMLRNALTDLRFAWVPRQATGDVVVIAIDAPIDRENRSLATAAPPPCRLAAAAGKR